MRDLPFTYWVFGRPVSMRNDDGGKPAALSRWRGIVNTALAEAVEAASRGRGLAPTRDRVGVCIFWLSVDPSDATQPDIDNMLKPLIDALNRTVIDDDRQVHRLRAEKACIDSPPRDLDDVIGDIEDDVRFYEIREVTVVRVLAYCAEHQ